MGKEKTKMAADEFFGPTKNMEFSEAKTLAPDKKSKYFGGAKKKKKPAPKEEATSTQRQIKFVARKKKKSDVGTKKEDKPVVAKLEEKVEKMEVESESAESYLKVTKVHELPVPKETETKAEETETKKEVEKAKEEKNEAEVDEKDSGKKSAVSKMDIDKPEKSAKNTPKEKLKFGSGKKTFGSGKKTFGSGKKKFNALSQDSPFSRAVKLKKSKPSPFSQAAKLKKSSAASQMKTTTPTKNEESKEKKIVTPATKEVKKSTSVVKTPTENAKFTKKAPKVKVLDVTKKTPVRKRTPVFKAKTTAKTTPVTKVPLPKMKAPHKTVTPSKRPATSSATNEPPAKKARVLTPLQRQQTAQWMNRADEPPNWGKKDAPSGAPFCLSGYRFVITGVLDSLKRDECRDLIMEYGGRVTGSVSGMTAYLVAGTDPGPNKVETAKEKKKKKNPFKKKKKKKKKKKS